jgi:hypothetical protein
VPRSRTIAPHTITLTDTDDGWRVEQDRRVLLDRLDDDEAVAYAERVRKPDEHVVKIDKDGYETDITRTLRKNRRASV